MSVQRQIERLTVHRAAEWLEVLRTGRSEEYPAFLQWINESPRHMDEFLKLLALSQEAASVMRSEAFDKTALLARLPSRVREFPGEPRAVAATLEPPHAARSSISPRPDFSAPAAASPWLARSGRARWAVGIAASLAIVSAAAWLTNDLWSWQRFETRIGEQGSFDLGDGSVVILNARSKLRVRLTDTAREIRLVDGEALFRVARDARRPFKVHTRDATVLAVGTQFDVASRVDGTRVAVLEGKVRVSSAKIDRRADRDRSNDAHAPLPLEAGEAAHVSLKGSIERKPAEEAVNATAWRQRRLIFERTPLEEAVNQFNRYQQSVQLRVEGVIGGSHHYSGTFDADDLRSFTDLLARERDLVVDPRGDEIVIRLKVPNETADPN